jgi:hypothetical protein
MDNSAMKGFSGPAWALVVASLLLVAGVTALAACGGTQETATVTTTVKSAVSRAYPRHWAARHNFSSQAPEELRRVADCLVNSGFDDPSRPAKDIAGSVPPDSVGIETRAGSYAVGIFPTRHQAYVYVYQQTSFPGASGVAVHGSYQGLVALYSEAHNDNGIAGRNSESHAYFAERTAVAACAFSIPAATGQPTSVY